MLYPAKVNVGDQGSYIAQFVDFPEGITFGRSECEVLEAAKDCLKEVFRSRRADGEPIPEPSRVFGPEYIMVSAQQ